MEAKMETGHVNDEWQNDLNVKLFDIGHSNVQKSNVKLIQMTNLKLFDVSYSNDECQNERQTV